MLIGACLQSDAWICMTPIYDSPIYLKAELTYVPASERTVAYRKARIWLAIYAAVVLAAIVYTWLGLDL